MANTETTNMRSFLYAHFSMEISQSCMTAHVSCDIVGVPCGSSTVVKATIARRACSLLLIACVVSNS